MPPEHPRPHSATWQSPCPSCADMAWWGQDPQGTGIGTPDIACPTCDD